MEFNLFSTANMAGGRSDELKRMLASVAEARLERPDMAIRLMLLMQNCPGEPGDHLSEEERQSTTLLAVPGLLPLSEARNVMLAEARGRRWLDGDGVVAFPDDDCWYPKGFLAHLNDSFERDDRLDFWFCQYTSRPVPIEPSLERNATIAEALRRASSNTMIFRNALVVRIGDFDPGLGVGTPLKGSEDTDYILRAFLQARKVRFLPQTAVGHRDWSAAHRAKYYPSGLLVIGRHAASHPALRSEFARKMAVGGAMVLRRELGPSSYLAALKAARREWARSRA